MMFLVKIVAFVYLTFLLIETSIFQKKKYLKISILFDDDIYIYIYTRIRIYICIEIYFGFTTFSPQGTWLCIYY